MGQQLPTRAGLSDWLPHPHEADVYYNKITNQQVARYYVILSDLNELKVYSNRTN